MLLDLFLTVCLAKNNYSIVTIKCYNNVTNNTNNNTNTIQIMVECVIFSVLFLIYINIG